MTKVIGKQELLLAILIFGETSCQQPYVVVL
jgi:hypothetical protein